ncbi:hypothetical protein ACLB3A_01910 [Corynebacterium freneyi]|uniref:Uncharacterized protein n=1 Tax=Corynebacterium freneyi DNF00450 TaxID=1287475 RepID=A0A095ZE56_9CORY|nr:hypothetical protein [Corynebacterium freneyi]KGF16957.1 hypothetical protein HMPREF1650_06380 [Corynebacterium freneyi DNF00450]
MTSDLKSIGLDYPRWQDAIEAAIATDHLSVIGEVRGGQLVRFEDPSGARLHILGVEPFSTFAGFAGLTQVTAHVSALDDVLALIEIVGDDPSRPDFDEVVATATCHLAQSPLLVDEGTQTFEHVNLAALAVDAAVDEDAAAFEARTGEQPGDVRFTGAEAVTGAAAGSTSPDASATLSGVVNSATKRTNRLTGQDFWLVHLDVPVPLDVVIPADVDAAPQPGTVVSGTFLLAGEVIAPQGCGDSCGDGGCGCGSGGCGGH